MRLRTVGILAILIVFALTCAAGAASNGASSKVGKIRVLFLVGGPYHDTPDVYNLFKPMLEGTGNCTVTQTKDLDQFKAENIKNYDVVAVYATRLELNKEQEQGLVQFIENGGGIVGIHCGATDTFGKSEAYWKMMGGRFKGHGNTTFKVHVTAKRHAAVQGMSDFDIHDETYTDEFNPQSKIVVLMRREMDSEPSVWVQYYGKGRVFATGLGHGKDAWQNPAFVKLIQQGTLWAAGRVNP